MSTRSKELQVSILYPVSVACGVQCVVQCLCSSVVCVMYCSQAQHGSVVAWSVLIIVLFY